MEGWSADRAHGQVLLKDGERRVYSNRNRFGASERRSRLSWTFQRTSQVTSHLLSPGAVGTDRVISRHSKLHFIPLTCPGLDNIPPKAEGTKEPGGGWGRHMTSNRKKRVSWSLSMGQGRPVAPPAPPGGGVQVSRVLS